MVGEHHPELLLVSRIERPAELGDALLVFTPAQPQPQPRLPALLRRERCLGLLLWLGSQQPRGHMQAGSAPAPINQAVLSGCHHMQHLHVAGPEALQASAASARRSGDTHRRLSRL